jgi:hypothetical protein
MEEEMDTNKITNQLDIKVKLSALWMARMLSGLQGDSTRLHDPVALQSLIAETGGIVVTNKLLLIMSLIFVVPIFMSFLSLTLKYPAIRRVNLSIGIFFAAFDLIFLGLALFLWQSTGYEIVWSIAYLAFTTLVVWYAWKWPNPEADNKTK